MLRMKLPHLATALSVLAGLTLALQDRITYDDTPFLPGGRYRVHGERPWPEVVDPGPRGGPPADALVLFDGSDLERWRSGDGPARWKLEEGALVVNGTGSITTRDSFGDLQLHLEFATPAQVSGDSQGRGNSGVFLMGRYEVQVLDSYQNPTYPDGQCAAAYGQQPPLVNASRAPGQWQSYDIVFHAPRFDGEQLAEPARVTVFHNGVLVHHDLELLGATTHRRLPQYEPHGPQGPIQLQDHGNPVRYRNIWVRELKRG